VAHGDAGEGLPTGCDLLLATDFKVIDLTDLDSISAGIDWWTNLTGSGGEGMVVKPADWIVRGKKGLVQPAVKCRGKEYLRIIYSPDYDSEENLPRLRQPKPRAQAVAGPS
jgi:protein phosphatase